MKIKDKHLQAVWESSQCLFDEASLAQAVTKMAAAIERSLGDSKPLLLCVMNGGLVTAGRLLPLLQFPLQFEYVHAASRARLRDEASRWPALSKLDLTGRHILLLDDIHDRGLSLTQLRDYCRRKGAVSVKTAVLVEKKHPRKSRPVPVDFFAVQVDDQYIFGAGMDYKGQLRQAPGINALDKKFLRRNSN
ncbi:MAG: hypoxanthine-guanine phosphoribosyltransferase [Cellvibrionaceae bacterium]|nr:hypoxanthine-guanine phosphoribosyltransferase [Cellvibrionaceae bacterium]